MKRPIVVIDDNANHLEFVVMLLERAGFDAHGFVRAKRAVEFLQKSNAAIVITDLFMPDMDGLEVLRVIRRDMPHIGIIGISGSQWGAGSHYLTAMHSLGAAHVIAKPLDPAALIEAVNKLYGECDPTCCEITC